MREQSTAPLNEAAYVEAAEHAPAYWACNVSSHRHELKATAHACIHSREQDRTRRWSPEKLQILFRRAWSGESVQSLADESQVAPSYLWSLLKREDNARLQQVRRLVRWDHQSDPW